MVHLIDLTNLFEMYFLKTASIKQITLHKRQNGLTKKAHDLSILCSVDVAVIILDKDKKFTFSSLENDADLRQIWKKYESFLDKSNVKKVSFHFSTQHFRLFSLQKDSNGSQSKNESLPGASTRINIQVSNLF